MKTTFFKQKYIIQFLYSTNIVKLMPNKKNYQISNHCMKSIYKLLSSQVSMGVTASDFSVLHITI